MYFQWGPTNGNAQLGMLDRMMDDRIIFFGGGALPRGACSGVSMSAGSWVLAPRHWSLDSRLFFGKIMDSKIIFFGGGRAAARLL